MKDLRVSYISILMFSKTFKVERLVVNQETSICDLDSSYSHR